MASASPDQVCWHTRRHHARRHILAHQGSGSDHGATTDRDALQHYRSSADPSAVLHHDTPAGNPVACDDDVTFVNSMSSGKQLDMWSDEDILTNLQTTFP